MKEKESAALDAANIENGEERKSVGGAALLSSEPQCSTTCHRSQGRVEAMLPRGERNAVRASQLVATLGFRSVRELQREVEFERLHGALILSTSRSPGGYFLPSEGAAGRREIADFIRTVHARAVNSQRILKAARRALRDCAG